MVKDAVVTFRLPEGEKALLARLAEADERTVSELSRKIVREWLRERGLLSEEENHG